MREVCHGVGHSLEFQGFCIIQGQGVSRVQDALGTPGPCLQGAARGGHCSSVQAYAACLFQVGFNLLDGACNLLNVVNLAIAHGLGKLFQHYAVINAIAVIALPYEQPRNLVGAYIQSEHWSLTHAGHLTHEFNSKRGFPAQA